MSTCSKPYESGKKGNFFTSDLFIWSTFIKHWEILNSNGERRELIIPSNHLSTFIFYFYKMSPQQWILSDMKWWIRVWVSNPNPLSHVLIKPPKSIYMVLVIQEPIQHDLILILWFYIILARLDVYLFKTVRVW